MEADEEDRPSHLSQNFSSFSKSRTRPNAAAVMVRAQNDPSVTLLDT